jgi:hypothetical protein
MSRRIYLLGIVIILVAGAFLITDGVLGQRPGVYEANARRIRKGMTARQVEAILGPPTACIWPLVSLRGSNRVPLESRHECLAAGKALAFGWGSGDAIFVAVGFNEKGLVDRVECDFPPNPPSLLERLRSWLGW